MNFIKVLYTQALKTSILPDQSSQTLPLQTVLDSFTQFSDTSLETARLNLERDQAEEACLHLLMSADIQNGKQHIYQTDYLFTQIQDFEKALRFFRDFAAATATVDQTTTFHLYYGLILQQLKKHTQACQRFSYALFHGANPRTLGDDDDDDDEQEHADARFKSRVLTHWAQSLFCLKKLDNSISLLQSAVEHDAKNRIAYMKLALISSLIGKIEAACECFDRALNLDPTNFMTLVVYTAFLAKHEKYVAALAVAKLAHSISTENEELNILYAALANHCGDSELALRIYESIFTVQDREIYAEAALRYSVILMQTGRSTQAFSTLHTLYQNDPKNPVVSGWFAIALFQVSYRYGTMHEHALEIENLYRFALENSPTEVALLYNYGQFLLCSKQHDAALICYERCMTFCPSDTAISEEYHELCLSLIREKFARHHFQEVLSIYKRMVPFTRYPSQIYNSMGWIYYITGRFSHALRMYKKSKALALEAGIPEPETLHFNLAILYFHLSQKEKSRVELQLAFESLTANSDLDAICFNYKEFARRFYLRALEFSQQSFCDCKCQNSSTGSGARLVGQEDIGQDVSRVKANELHLNQEFGADADVDADAGTEAETQMNPDATFVSGTEKKGLSRRIEKSFYAIRAILAAIYKSGLVAFDGKMTMECAICNVTRVVSLQDTDRIGDACIDHGLSRENLKSLII